MKDNKRILIFCTSYFPDVGGAEIAVKEITDRINDFEWCLIAFSSNRNLPKEEKIGNIFVYRTFLPKFIFPLIAFWKAYKLHKEKKFDLIWSIMATYAGFAGVFFKLQFPNVKFLLTLQEGDPLSLMKRKAWFVYPLFMMIFRLADKIQAISNFLAFYARDMGHKEIVSVVPNGVDINNFLAKQDEDKIFKLKSKLGKKEKDIYLVTASRLVHKNAVDDVIKSLKYLVENIHFIILGVGAEESSLRKLANDENVRDRVKFLGFVDHKDIPLFFAISDIFIRPSRSEGFGNSFIEAMATGLPVVTTPVGGIVDFIDDLETGVFVSPNNPKSIADGINLILSDKNLMQKIATQGKKRVLERYSWDIVVKSMNEEVFKPLLGFY